MFFRPYTAFGARMRHQTELVLVPALHRAVHRISVYLQNDNRLGVSQGEAHILTHLWSHGDSTVSDLHEAFGHRRSTLTSILDRLAERGFVSRQSSQTDRRTFVIHLTAEGKKRAERVFRALQAFEEQALSKISSSQLTGFSAVVSAVGKA